MVIKFQGFTHALSVQPSDLRAFERLILGQKGNSESLQQTDLEKVW